MWIKLIKYLQKAAKAHQTGIEPDFDFISRESCGRSSRKSNLKPAKAHLNLKFGQESNTERKIVKTKKLLI